MKKLSRLAVLGVAAVAAMILVAPVAHANCGSAVLWGQTDGACADCTSSYHYVVLPPGADIATLLGYYWQAGNFGSNRGGSDGPNIATWNSPSENPPGTGLGKGWLKTTGGGAKYVNGDLQLEEFGCIPVGGTQVLVLEAKGLGANSGQAFIAVSRVDNPSGGDANRFNLNRVNADVTLLRTPHPKIVSRSQVGSVVTLGLQFDSASSAFYCKDAAGCGGSAITGLRIVRKNAPNAAADSRDFSGGGWVDSGTGAPTGGGPVAGFQIDCGTVPSGNDVLLATQVALQDGQLSKYVSQSTPVKCSGNIADPNQRFKVIDRRPPARGVRR